jgi:division protein CdvB (Snf7/Vps24/ESCRT-III family)
MPREFRYKTSIGARMGMLAKEIDASVSSVNKTAGKAEVYLKNIEKVREITEKLEQFENEMSILKKELL